MSRFALTVVSAQVTGTDMEQAAATADGTGNGVEFASTTTAPAILVVANNGVAPITLTVPAKSPKAETKGVEIGDFTQVVAAGEVGIVWVPPDYYATDGVVACDTSEKDDVTFSAVKFPSNSLLKFD